MHFWDLLHRWDQILTLFLNQIHNPATDQFMVFMSDRAAWFPMYAFVAFCLVWRLGWKKGLISIVCVALTLLACDQTANLLKYSVARLRPCYSSYVLFGGLHVLETRGSLFGFFSAHAANAFGFAMCTSMLFRYDLEHKYKAYIYTIFVWAICLSMSRIFVGKHYLGDVLVGAIIGSGYGALTATFAKFIFAKYIDKKAIPLPGKGTERKF